MCASLDGSKFQITWYAITILFIILQKSCFTTFSLPMNKTSINNTYINPSSLEDYLYIYSSKAISQRRHTGVLLNVPLPSNFSGMKVSIVRLRSSTLWGKGANYSSFDIPRKAIIMPYVKRYAIMYENLGNFSSNYYDLPGFTILSSIIGIAVYNATDLSSNTNTQRLNFTISGEPIKVRFPNDQVKLPQDKNLNDVRCVRFDSINGLIVLNNMIKRNVCLTRSLGLFAIAMPGVSAPESTPLSPRSSKNQEGVKFARWKRWLIGFIVGLVGLMLLVSGFVIGYRAFGLQKMARMERKAEKSETLDTRWIGTSKMPSAHVTRTAAVLENDLAP